MQEILILYYSQTGAVRQMAQFVARGVEKVPQMGARLRTVPKVSTVAEATEPAVPDAGRSEEQRLNSSHLARSRMPSSA